MAIDFLLGDNNDIVFRDKDFTTTNSPKDILKQKIYIIFQTFVGEWFLNTQFGGYNKDVFLNKQITKDGVDAYFTSILLSIPEVDEILFFNSSFTGSNRTYSCNFAVKSIAGTGTFTVNLLPPSSEVAYPPSNTSLVGACAVVDTASVNEFYELMNIRIPLEIPWD